MADSLRIDQAVIFVLPEGHPHGRKAVAAVITGIEERYEGVVHLEIDGGEAFGPVAFHPAGLPGTWHWPRPLVRA